MKLLRLFLLTWMLACTSALTAFAADPSGTWKFKAEAPNGHSVESTLELKWANQQLTGTIDNLAGKAELRDARFANDEISFNVVRKFRRREITTHYTGKLEGDTIKGTIQSKRRGDTKSAEWLATRAK